MRHPPHVLLRDPSIDVLKGLGIILVIIGHVFEAPVSTVIYVFHMPLFFFVGGYLSRSQADLRGFLAKKAVQLLIPYFAFVLVLTGLQTVMVFFRADAIGAPDIATLILGGEKLVGWFGVFWFPTCYFLTVIVYNALRVACSERALWGLIALMVALAIINQYYFPEAWLPWAANVMLMSLPVFHIGAKYRTWIGFVQPTALFYAALGVFAFGYLLLVVLGEAPTLAMKRAGYGLPVLTMVAAIAATIILLLVSKDFARIPVLATGLSYCGTASLTIMYLHQPIQLFLVSDFGVYNPFALTLASLVGSLSAHIVFMRWKNGRRVLLGMSS